MMLEDLAAQFVLPLARASEVRVPLAVAPRSVTANLNIGSIGLAALQVGPATAVRLFVTAES